MQVMAKDKTFNLRLDEEDRARLEVIAHHLSAPAATAVRMLVKEKYDRLVDEGKAMPIAVVEGRAYQLRVKDMTGGRKRYDVLIGGQMVACADSAPSGIKKYSSSLSKETFDRVFERFMTLGFIK
jgi:hypothetical protein